MNKISFLCSSLCVIKFYYVNEWVKLNVENVFVSGFDTFCIHLTNPVALKMFLSEYVPLYILLSCLLSSVWSLQTYKSHKFSYRVKEAGPQLFDRPALNICVSHPTHRPELLIGCTQMNTDDLSVFSVLNECKQCSFANLTYQQSHRGHYSSTKRVNLSRKSCE